MGRSEPSARDPGRCAAAVRVSEPAAAQTRRAVGSRWVDACNARDLHGMLACPAEDIDFYPCRLSGPRDSYRGHDGVREWFARLERLRHEHPIVRSDTRDLGGGRVFASGVVSLGGQTDVGPVSAVQRIPPADPSPRTIT